jgi:two-component system sensor histidine kinase DctS/two-component system sensor kinase FixL
MNLSLENALDILKAQLFSHGVQIHLELDPDLPMVLGYENQMEEIIINLIVNAMQSLDRVPRNKDRIITCISKADNNVILEIRDKGVGISSENMNKIFDPFFSTKEGQGMGMGLFIAKSIITTLNGSIRCDSNQEHTTFRIELPPYRG